MIRLFLDDTRDPIECSEYMHRRIGKENVEYLKDWKVVRTFEEFKDFIYTNPNLDLISLDYDLNENEDWDGKVTGYDCLVFLIRFYRIKNMNIPKIYVHSTNKKGTMHLKLILDLYKTYKNKVLVFPTINDMGKYMDYYNVNDDSFMVEELKQFTSIGG